MRFKAPICRTLVALCCGLAAQGALAQAPATAGSASTRTPVIDVHSHFQADRTRHFPSALRTALAKMDELGIVRTLLMPPPLVSRGANYYDIEELRFAAQQHPDRVAIMGGSSLNVMIHDTDPKSGDPGQDQGIRWLRSLVDALPAPLAEAVARRNAMRLYKLPDSPPVPPRAALPSPVN